MRALLSAALFLWAGGAVFAQESHTHSASKPVTVDIKNVQGQSVGTATLTHAAPTSNPPALTSIRKATPMKVSPRATFRTFR